jgi:hypothetical protein
MDFRDVSSYSYYSQCPKLTGWFSIHEIAFSASTGNLERLNMTFTQRCDGGIPALRGSIAYRSRMEPTPPPGTADPEPTASTDTTPPPPAGAVQTLGASSSATVAWTNPDTDYATTEVRLAEASDTTSGTLAYSGQGESVEINGLDPTHTYKVSVVTRDAAGNVSDPVSAKLESTRLATTVSPSLVSYGQSATAAGKPLAGQSVRVLARAAGGEWRRVATVTTDAAGVARTTLQRATNTFVRLVFDGAEGVMGTRAADQTLHVKPVLALKARSTTVTAGYSYYLYGTVAPDSSGETVILQRRVDGAWKRVEARQVTNTMAAFSVRVPLGRRVFRVYKPADADHASAVSNSLLMIGS